MRRFRGLQKVILVFSMIAMLTAMVFASDTTVTNYAGSGDATYKDDKRLQSGFNQPYGLAVGKDGGLIVVDTYNNRIRKIQGDSVTTIAGLSDKKDSLGFPAGGFADGEALIARFNKPRDAAVDSKGNIFITDTDNNAIRKISGGKVYTFAGAGDAGYMDGRGGEARFNGPIGIAIDKDDNVYVADSLNHVVRKITQKGEVSTFAGKCVLEGGYNDGPSDAAMFNEPSDIGIGRDGAVYILDSGNQSVRKINKDEVTTIAGIRGELLSDTGYVQGGYENGKASEAMFNFPKGIYVADDGTILIADTWNHMIRAIDPAGNVTTIAGTGEPGRDDGYMSKAEFNAPVHLLYNAGFLYISDMWNNSIRVIPMQLKELPRKMDREEIIGGIKFAPKSKQVQIWIDRKRVIFPDTQPYNDAGKVYAPIRFVLQTWGAEVRWRYITQRVDVIKGDFRKTFTYSSGMLFDREGRTVIYVRKLAESMGFYVEWVPEYNAVVLSTGE